RGTRKSYWNFSEWSLRPTSIWASGKSRFTASAITCSAEWRITSAPAGSRSGTSSSDASARSGGRGAPQGPPLPPASARRGRPLPAALGDGEHAGPRRHQERLAVRQADLDLVHDGGRFIMPWGARRFLDPW